MNNHLEVTLTAGCPMMCSYCPQGNYIRGYKATNNTSKKLMSIEDYKIILSNVDRRITHIFFTGFTEALAHPEWDKFVEHTKEQNYKITFNTTLYGATFEKIDRLIELDVDVEIHLTDSNIDISEEMILYFAKKYRRGEPVFNFFTEKGKNLLPKQLRGHMHHAHSRGDNLEHIPRTVIKGPVRCHTNRYFSNVVVPNGDVSVCCSDFSLKHIMGNLLTQKLKDIHRSQPMKAFLKQMREGDESFICNNCDYAYAG